MRWTASGCAASCLFESGSVMLEPLAASVISTVFSARPFALPTSAQTAFKATTRASSSALPPNFFDPHPRRTLKGKERAHSGLPYSLHAEDDASKRCVGTAATTSVSGMCITCIFTMSICSPPHQPTDHLVYSIRDVHALDG